LTFGVPILLLPHLNRPPASGLTVALPCGVPTLAAKAHGKGDKRAERQTRCPSESLQRGEAPRFRRQGRRAFRPPLYAPSASSAVKVASRPNHMKPCPLPALLHVEAPRFRRQGRRAFRLPFYTPPASSAVKAASGPNHVKRCPLPALLHGEAPRRKKMEMSRMWL
jgi:hypothetical protein